MKYRVKKAYEWLFPDDECICGGNTTIQIPCARNTSEAVQILLHRDQEAERIIDFTVKDICPGIEPGIYQLLPVFVEKNTGTDGYTSDVQSSLCTKKAPFWVYDVLKPCEDVPSFDREGRCALYICFDIDKEAQPGKSVLTIELCTRNGETAAIRVELDVCEACVTDTEGFMLSNWYSLPNIAKRHGLQMWSPEFWNMTDQYFSFMEQMHQTHFLLPMVCVEIQRANDIWTFDFRNAEKLIQIAKKHGAKYIEGAPAVKQKFLGDEVFVLTADEKIPALSSDGKVYLRQYFSKLRDFLQEHDLMECFVQHVVDEPFDQSIKAYNEIAKLIRAILPQVHLIDAVCTNRCSEEPDIVIPNVKRFEDSLARYDALKSEGKEIWTYTCSEPGVAYCNRLLDQPLLQCRQLFWGNYKYGARGYLHWGLNCYREEQEPFHMLCPKFTAVHDERYLPAGDTHLVYPSHNEPLGSVRLEQIRKGMEDVALLSKVKNQEEAMMLVNKCVRGYSSVCDLEQFEAIYKQLIQK